MGRNMEWQIRTMAVVDCRMECENWGMVPFEFGCTTWSIEEPKMRDNLPEVVCDVHGGVDTKARIQISEWTVSIIEKNGQQYTVLKQQ